VKGPWAMKSEKFLWWLIVAFLAAEAALYAGAF
jgi:hypothetical protein